MPVQFFGQFLIESGEVDASELREALELQAERNRKFGEWAVWCGYLTQDQVDRINQAQRLADRFFGELAIELGYLTAGQVSELLTRQVASQIRVGEALVEIGALERDRLAQLLARFEAEQRPWAPGTRSLPAELRGVALAELALEMLPRVALRSLCAPLKLGADRPWPGCPEFEFRALLPISGKGGADMGLALDRSAAESVAMALQGVPESADERDWLLGGVAHLLLVLATNVVRHLAERAVALEAGAPRPNALPECGTAFELALHHGAGFLIFGPPE